MGLELIMGWWVEGATHGLFFKIRLFSDLNKRVLEDAVDVVGSGSWLSAFIAVM